MAHIRIESIGESIKVEIDGNGSDLVNILAQSILKDPNLGLLFMAAVAAIGDTAANPINQINLN
jgi:hypothetical protein